jgi:hypothetical protein
VNHPELDLAYIGPIVDYLYEQRIVPCEDLFEEGEVAIDPPQPNLSMKAHTPRSLLHQLAEWQARLRRRPRGTQLRWRWSSIGEFRWVEPEGSPSGERCWTIRVLLSSGELYGEGIAMGHCVARYVASSARPRARRKISIWSMHFQSAGRRHRVLTIEGELATRTICQARRHGDAWPTDKPRGILERCAQEGLTIGC